MFQLEHVNLIYDFNKETKTSLLLNEFICQSKPYQI